jgi:kexin
LCVESAVPFNTDNPEWEKTFSGKLYNHNVGYGRLDTAAMIDNARNFTTLGAQVTHDSGRLFTGPNVLLAIPEGETGIVLEYSFKPETARKLEFLRLEHITVTVTIHHQFRGDIEITLISPHNVSSVLATARPFDSSTQGLHDWRFMTVKHW